MFVENIFENRFQHVEELTRMGADIEVDGSPIRDDAIFKVLLSTEFNSLFARVLPEHELPLKLDKTLSADWTALICDGVQPAAAEDYIEIR